MLVQVCMLTMLLAFPTMDSPRSPAAQAVHFDQTAWDEVLRWACEQNGLQLVMESIPPGRFTYTFQPETPGQQVLRILQEALANRGIALVERSGMLLVVRLVDDVVWDLVPFIQAGELDRWPATAFVMSSLFVRTLDPSVVIGELDPFLSPRGRVAAVHASRRIVVWDTVGVIRHLRELLDKLDNGAGPNAIFRVFALRHIPALRAASVIQESLGLNVPLAPGPLVDFQELGRQLGNRQMLQAFLPGFSLGGLVPDAPRTPIPTRLSVDERTNSLLVTAEPDVIASVRRIIEAVDQKEPASGVDLVIRTYRVGMEGGQAMAGRLQHLFADEQGWQFAGSGDFVIIRATPEGHQQIARLLDQSRQAQRAVEVFSLDVLRAENLAETLTRIFEDQPADQRPKIVANSDGNKLIVYGSPEQISMVRRSLPLSTTVPTQPSINIHR